MRKPDWIQGKVKPSQFGNDVAASMGTVSWLFLPFSPLALAKPHDYFVTSNGTLKVRGEDLGKSYDIIDIQAKTLISINPITIIDDLRQTFHIPTSLFAGWVYFSLVSLLA